MSIKKSRLFLCTISIMLYSIWVNGQNYVPGMIVTTNGDQIKGEIDFGLWQVTPGAIDFRNGGKAETYDVNSIAGFQVFRKDGFTEVFASKKVDIDVSTQNTSRMNDSSTPELESKQLFLKLLLEGPLTMYRYEGKEKSHYFLEEASGTITELEHRKYSVKKDGTTNFATSNRFRNQLSILTNDCTKSLNASSVNYTSKSLKKYLLKYYDCKDEVPTYSHKFEKIRPSFYAHAGIGLTQYKRLTISASQAGSTFGIRFLRGKSSASHIAYQAAFSVDVPFNKKISYHNELQFTNQILRDSVIVIVSDKEYEKGFVDFGYLNFKTINSFRYYFLKNPSKFYLSLGFSIGAAITKPGTASYQRRFFSTNEQNVRTGRISISEIGGVLGVGYQLGRTGVEARLHSAAGGVLNANASFSYRVISLGVNYRLNKNIYILKKD